MVGVIGGFLNKLVLGRVFGVILVGRNLMRCIIRVDACVFVWSVFLSFLIE